MTDTPQTPQGEQLPARLETGLALLPPAEPAETNRDYLVRLMEMLPDPSEDVVDKIMGQILAAPTPMAENQLWDALGSRDAVGRRFIFRSCHILPSDYEEAALPYFLVCRVTDLESGEETVLSTGSANIVTSLVKAQVLGQLPWEAEIVAPKRTPKSGRVPLRLRWIARVVEPGEETS